MSIKHINEITAGSVLTHYTIESLICHGGCGNVYKVKSDFSDSNYLLKVEYTSSKQKQLENEFLILSKIQGSPYFPNIIDHRHKKPYIYNVLELYGPSVTSIQRNLPDYIYSPSCAIFLAIKMLKAVKELHRKGYIHRDIKPDNFLIRSNIKYPIVLIDFGIAKQLYDENGNHIPFEHNCQFVGTYKYASLNVMKGETPSRRDDLISWFYSVVELYTGRLPWPGAKNIDKTVELKESVSPAKLIKNMPKEFLTIYITLSNLQFSDDPPYNTIFSLLYKVKSKTPNSNKPTFDWDYLPKDKIEEVSPIGMIKMHNEELTKPILPPEEPKKPKPKKYNKECNVC